MRRLRYTLLLLLCPLLLFGQGLKCYEYWADDDYASRRVVNSSAGTVTINMSYAKQTPGLHYLNFRSQDTEGNWSALKRFLYYVPTTTDEPTTTPTISGYEYWVDDDYASHRVVNSSEATVTINMSYAKQTSGLHYLNFRSQDTEGNWSALKRMIFYVSDAEEEEVEGVPITSYSYRFNQQTTTVDIGYQTSYQLSDYTFDIPELVEAGNLEDGCTFTFDGTINQAHLERTQPMSFVLQFQKENGEKSMPVSTTFTMSDALDRAMQPLPLNGHVDFSKPNRGDFAAFRIDLEDEVAVNIKATQPCTVQLFEIDGTAASLPLVINDKAPAVMILPDGTYYGIVYYTVKNEIYPHEQIRLKLHADGYQETLESISSTYDVQDFANSLDPNTPCTAEAPLTIPVTDGYQLTDEDHGYIGHSLPEGYSWVFDPLTSRLTVYQTPVNLGDVNGDGQVDAWDVVVLVNYIMGNPLEDSSLMRANVNNDGRVTVTDAVAIANIILEGE